MRAQSRQWLNSPGFRFLVAGGVNTLFGWGLFLLILQLPLPLWAVVGLSTIGAVAFNFQSIGRWAFRSRISLGQLPRFLAVYGLLYGVNLSALEWADSRGISLVLASGALLLPMAALSYLLNRGFVFRP